jgi:MYXO-CTERM domain-containing protein
MGRLVATVALLALSVVLSPVSATAQVSLTGDYITYLYTGSTGSMISGTRSMQYREDGSAGTSCDAFYPGSPVEQFSIEGTGASAFSVTNTYSSGGVTTSAGYPMVSGRQLLWRGTYTSGTTSFTVDQVMEMEMDARLVRVAVTIENTGSSDIRDLYYMRDADPDHGSGCSGGSGTSTDNDVRRAFPGDTSALVTAGAMGGAYYVIGLGTFDDRAKASASGFANTDPSSIYDAPADAGGVSADISIDLVFLEPLLAAGASTTFEFFYVWGRTVEEVEDRFDTGGGGVAGPCDGLMELAACTTSRGVAGTCRGGVCCTGCWDGTRCVGGRSATGCGLGGGACRSCVDTDACSSDVCTDGVCSNPDAPRGTRCDDGLFCTRVDTCDGMRRCTGSGDQCDDGSACTIDTCTEASDSCTNVVTADRCIIGGECVANMGRHPAYPCLVCDPTRDNRDWSTLPEGTSCGEAACVGGRLTTEATCSSTGVCTSGVPVRCDAGYCADGTTCASSCTEGECPGDSYCAPSGVCELRRANASSCTRDEECDSGFCVDRLCCSDACTGTCESCQVPGSVGSCTIVPAMTDPDGECGDFGYCDGMGACAGPDAGPLPPDAGPSPDAASPTGNPDAGSVDGSTPPLDAGTTTPPTSSGCGCRVGASARLSPWALALLGLVLVVARRRARR